MHATVSSIFSNEEAYAAPPIVHSGVSEDNTVGHAFTSGEHLCIGEVTSVTGATEASSVASPSPPAELGDLAGEASMESATLDGTYILAADGTPRHSDGPTRPPMNPPIPAYRRIGHGRKRITQFEIGFDNNRTIFMPGQRIEGHVFLTVKERVVIRILRLRFSGSISTRMSRKENSMTSGSTTTVLFKELMTVLGAAGEEERITLEPGEYVYPFSFRVPLTSLPASFEGNFGRIKYEVTGILARPNVNIKTCSAVLTIPSTVDAADSQYQAPLDTKLTIPVGFWLWRTGHLNASLSLPKGAYSSEEVVPLTLDVVNHSASGAVLKDVYMKQSVIYKTGTETRGPNTERVHRLTFSETFPAHTRHVRRIINFPIPSTSIFSPTIKTTNLEVSHTLVVKISSTRKLAKAYKLEIPITIAGFPSTLPDFGLNGCRESIDTLPIYSPPPISTLSRDIPGRASFGLRRSISTTRSRAGIVTAVPLRADEDTGEEDARARPNEGNPAAPSASSMFSSYSSMYRRRQANESTATEEARRRRSNSRTRSLGRLGLRDGDLPSSQTSPTLSHGNGEGRIAEALHCISPEFVETDSEDESERTQSAKGSLGRSGTVSGPSRLHTRMQALPESGNYAGGRGFINSEIPPIPSKSGSRSTSISTPPRSLLRSVAGLACSESPVSASAASSLDSSPSPSLVTLNSGDARKGPLRNKDSAVALDSMGEGEAEEL
ncbi:hypothetical protein HDU67_006214 [Dinochytrium kinnereticum]|nr:hypothetical protein HDU67_006214 [Dinochytrium kinnereticum]